MDRRWRKFPLTTTTTRTNSLSLVSHCLYQFPNLALIIITITTITVGQMIIKLNNFTGHATTRCGWELDALGHSDQQLMATTTTTTTTKNDNQPTCKTEQALQGQEEKHPAQADAAIREGKQLVRSFNSIQLIGFIGSARVPVSSCVVRRALGARADAHATVRKAA